MKKIDAKNIDYRQLNDIIKENSEITLVNCEGQRFIGSGTENKKIIVYGVAGNALGAYNCGSFIETFSNAQDAVGDTMNKGKIVVHGSVGDSLGYAMRGGEIFVEQNAGYRAGIHIKEYGDIKPVIVIGGKAGCFLGEYQAGGLIIVLNLNGDKIVGDYCGTGMHGGKMFLRTSTPPTDLPSQVKVEKATDKDLKEIEKYVAEYCEYFGRSVNEILNSDFYVLTPNSANPYRQLYVQN